MALVNFHKILPNFFMYFPSLLSYSLAELQSRCLLIRNNQDLFRTLTNQKKERIILHADIVLADFAKERNVKKSTDFAQVFEVIFAVFKLENVILQVHIMGQKQEELNEIRQVLKLSKKFGENIKLEVFIKENYEEFEKQKVNDNSFKFYKWQDKNEWENGYLLSQKNLLMTVKAGVGGQLFEEQGVDFLKKTGKTEKIILDGGVKFDTFEKLDMPDFDAVMGSGFWQKFEEKIKKGVKN